MMDASEIVKLKSNLLFGILLIVILITPSAGRAHSSRGKIQLSADSFKDHFENYYSSNSYLTSQQKEQYEEYWTCILTGKTEHILQNLHWTAQHGHFDDYFMALNYLVYVHDNHVKSPRLLELIENLIDHSVQQNIVQSSVLLTKSVTYNIVKYLFDRFRPNHEPVQEVNYAVVDFQAPNYKDIQKLIEALGPSQPHSGYHTLLVNYLHAMPHLVYRQLDFKQPPRTCLKQILALLLDGSTHISPNLREACQYYLQLFRHQEVEYQAKQRNLQIIQQLISFIPNFNSPHKRILLEFLTTGDVVHNLIRMVGGHPMASQSYLYNLLVKGLSYSNITGPVKHAFEFYVNYFQSLNVFSQLSHKIPHFVNSPGKEYYQLLVGFLNGQEFINMLGSIGLGHLDIRSTHLLQDTLTMLKTNSHVSAKIQTAASYYVEYYDILSVREKYSLGQLFNLIPQPTLSTEKLHYDQIKGLFDSMTFLQIIKQNNLHIVSDHKVMLHEILNCALQSTYFDLQCKEAILHYFKFLYNEGLTIQQEQNIELLLQELRSVEVETTVYETIASFLRSDLAYLVFQETHFNFTMSSFTILEEIFEIITHLEYLDVTVLKAASFYKTQVHEAFEYENQLITKIHHAFTSLQGVSTQIVEKYEMDLDVFLQCDEMHAIIRHGHFDIDKDEKELLYDVLLVVEEDINVSMEIREGAYHYCKYILEPQLGNVSCDMDELLKLLPQPSNHVTQRYFNTLKMYLQHGVPRFLISQIDFTKTRIDLLLDILQALVYCDQIPVDVRGTARYYWHFFNTSNVRVDGNVLANLLDRLTLLLPRPTSIHETQYYNLMINYLKGNLIVKLLNTISVNLHKPDVRILRDILVVTLNTKLVYMDIKIVARYYLNMIDNGIIGDVSIVMVPVAPTEETEIAVPVPIHVVPVYHEDNQHLDQIHRFATVGTTKATQALKTTQITQGTTKKVVKAASTAATTTASSTVAASRVTKQATAATEIKKLTTAKATSATAVTEVKKLAAVKATPAIPATPDIVPSNVGTTISTTKSTSTSVAVQKTSVIQKIERELDQMNISETNMPDRQVLYDYLKTPTALNILETSDVNVEASGSNLLADFVKVAAHTNDIPHDLRLASERYESIIPSLHKSVTVTPHTHLVVLDNIFHKIVKPTSEADSPNVVICYNAVDRYLHTEVPGIIMQGTHIDLKTAPVELLQDMLLVSKECTLPKEDIETIQNLMAQSREMLDIVEWPLIEHLYRLHKIFQLIELPEDKTCVEYYYTLDSYLRGNIIFEILQSNEVDFNVDLMDLLKAVLTLTINAKHVNISNEIMQAAIYFFNLMFTPSVDKELDVVFHLIPQPEEEGAIQAFDTVNEYIHSPNAVELAQNVNFDNHRQPSAILTNVLDLASHNTKVTSEVRHAAEYLLSSKMLQASRSTSTIKSQRSTFSHSSVHSMKVLTSRSSTTHTSVSKYETLLNILPESFASGPDFGVLKEYFGHLSPDIMNDLLVDEKEHHVDGNEEGLLRLLLQKFVHDSHQPDNVRTACAHLIKQRYFNFGDLILHIPSVAYPEEEGYHTLVTQLLGGDEIYRYFDLSLTEYETNLNSFKLILTTLSTCKDLTPDIREAFNYYVNHAPFFDFASLASLLPEATSTNIKKLHSTMVHFLTTNSLINRCTQSINLSGFASDDLLLKEVLLMAEKCDWLEENIRVAAKYYLTVIKSVAVSVQKVLTKTLDLGDIFNDAFDFSSFSKMQFDAYHEFWTYVSERTQEILSSPGFDFWMDKNKRGEFTTKFLVALSEKSEVPRNILDDIVILSPLVHNDHVGALDV